MLATTERCVGEYMKNKTMGDILRPTKGVESYAKIALRANNWLREEADKGRKLEVFRMSSEQVRRIFENETASPKPIYLEALAAAQRVDVNELYKSAGLPIPMIESNDPIQRVEFALDGQDNLDDWQIEAIKRLVEQRRKK